MSTEPRTIDGYTILGEARDCHELIEIYRDRKSALRLTDRWFDEYSGLARGHLGKLIGDAQVKRLGPDSIYAINASLAVKFIVVIDDAQAAFMAGKWEERLKPAMPMPATASIRALERFRPIITREIVKRITPMGGKARMAKMTPKQRKRLARRAARIRWKIERESRRKVAPVGRAAP